ncbi:MAG: adenylate/guanylate cyclase domain-containing protein [Nitrospirae bacterium]|nr:MAG: adenylate/guanylate cyclase domain-containing protein [Nitrospirota bacterium]
MTRSTKRRLLVSGALALAVASLLTAAYRLTFLSTTQIHSTDFLFASQGTDPAQATVIVGIDQRSYRALLPRYGPLVNWPRTLYAQAVDRLHEAGARVVAFDIFFDAPTPEDPTVAAAIRRAGIVVTPVEAQGPKDLVPRPGIAQEFDVFVRPTAAIRDAAVAEGFVNVTTDQDTVVRSLPLQLTAGPDIVPALALTAVARFVRRPGVIDEPAAGALIFGAGRAIPVGQTGSMRINFLGGPSSPEHGGPFTILPFASILDSSFNPALVRDKIVLIGLTIRGVDEFATPTTAETRMWGVEVLANAVETILRQRFLVPVSDGTTILLIVASAVLASLLVAVGGPRHAALGVIGALGLYWLAAGLLFDNGVVLNLVYPPGALLLGFAAAMVYRVAFEQAEQKMIRGVMARYLSPSVSHWALKDPERLKLGGDTRTMTVLFSDLRGFTTLSHALEPQALVALLNEYMTAMTEIVFRHDGVLDKYIGDAIMAFWNAPMAQPDHARRACRTALDMIARLRLLNADWQRRGLRNLDVGIGINTGPMVVGNMGSRDRLAYTVMGDTVNVAARLEGLSKEYGTRLVVGEAVKAEAGEAFLYRFLDLVAVKGRAEPLAVYEVLSRAGELEPARAAFVTAYERGIALYRSRRWAEAAALFETIQADMPEDGPSSLYLRRSRALLASPPPEDWNGVYVAQHK